MAKKFKFNVPHVYVILVVILVVCALLTYIVPSGEYNMIEVDGREVVDSETYHSVESSPVGITDLLLSIPVGLYEVASIIFFILIVGGAFNILNSTRAVEASLGVLITRLNGKEILLIPVIMLCFSFGSATIGMAEEALPFIPMVVSLTVAARMDSLVGVAMVTGASGVGFAGSFLNPFTVGVAQGVAELPPFSGMGLRIALFIALNVVTITMVMRYALKIRKDPTKSPMYELDKQREDRIDLDNLIPFTIRHKLVMLVLLATVIVMMWGVISKGWYFDELAALFLAMSIAIAVVSKTGPNKYSEEFQKGVESLAGVAIIVGLARAVLVVLTEGSIIHTILHGMAEGLQGLPLAITAIGMILVQILLSFLVSSGSGQAAISMPVMAPLADIVGLTRQTAVLAFQVGDGIFNVVNPTSGYFMAGLGLAKVPYAIWLKWVWPIILSQLATGCVFVVIAQAIGYGPF